MLMLTKAEWCTDTGKAATASKARQSVLEESEDEEEELAAKPAGVLQLPCSQSLHVSESLHGAKIRYNGLFPICKSLQGKH